MARLSALILLALLSACAAKRPAPPAGIEAAEPLDPSIKPLTVEQEEQAK